MARKEPDPPLELDPLKGGLKHNPFAGLRGKVAGADASPADTPPAVASPTPATPKDKVWPGPERSAATPASAASDLEVTRHPKSLEAPRSPNSDGARAPVSKAASLPSGAKASKSASAQERVTVRFERTGRGGKTVTIAEGPGLAGHALEPLSREIARGMGTGARVEGSSIVVQGDQRERLVDWLGARGFGGAVVGN
jgi:translation initiation factor 1